MTQDRKKEVDEKRRWNLKQKRRGKKEVGETDNGVIAFILECQVLWIKQIFIEFDPAVGAIQF